MRRFLVLSSSTDKFWFCRQPNNFKNSRGRLRAFEYLPEKVSLRTTIVAINVIIAHNLIMGDPRTSEEPTVSLEQKYANLGSVLEKCDQLIPSEGLEIWENGLHGTRTEKPKAFQATTGFQTIKETLTATFTDPKQQEEVLDAVSSFLSTVAKNVDPKDRDSVPMGQLDRFLVGFPKNLIERLGPKLAPKTVGQILKIGEHIIEHQVEEAKEENRFFGATFHENHAIGDAVLLVGEVIPVVAAQAGGNQEKFLNFIDTMASSMPYYRIVKKVEAFQLITEQSQNLTEPEKVQSQMLDFMDKIRATDPDIYKLPTTLRSGY